MKAVFLDGHGGNEVVKIGQRPQPVPGPGEALVRLNAATLNRVDLYMRDSGAGITHTLPQVMGLDGSGRIEQLNAPESLLAVGQEVVVHPGISCGHCEYCLRGETVLCTTIRFLGEHRDGTLAEYVCLPARNVFPKPAALSHAEAAALGVNHLTAWRMLFTKARLQPGETVLIFGIGGGVSLAALQFAREIGARAVVTSRDDEKLRRALAMGAAFAINSSSDDVARKVMAFTGGRGVDVVFENVGQAVWPSALRSLARGGRLVLCGATSGDAPSADLRRLFVRHIQIFGSSLGTLDEYRHMLAFIQNTGLRPVIDASYALDDIHAALEHLESGRQFGKIAVEIAQGGGIPCAEPHAENA
ncbi:NADPH:quinone reductase [Allopusillimonas soli]|uniref:Zinc-binding dehydrogenase n=1 Tax=Allopusillimonas soli TaxID=659016 RepID=A0A853F9C5_9BURK|nr:zinc-binding dehydrogenase [Allopusillimonas soli]NYT37285.1 zinc-binding dehydrogenase [Allopusillimonas soli]TEA74721.1 NADPH:quinone reductase [Allopusillimonas soli]